MVEHLCVYTALFGRYEDLLAQPIAAESELDFICFTDDPELSSDSWRIELVEPPLRSDPARSSRYPKICAHRFLDGYDTSLYIDNSVLLTRAPEEIVEMLLPDRGAAFGAAAHSFRETVEDEFVAVMDAGLDAECASSSLRTTASTIQTCSLSGRLPGGSWRDATGVPTSSLRWSDGGTTFSATPAATSYRSLRPSPTHPSRRSSSISTSKATSIGSGLRAPVVITTLSPSFVSRPPWEYPLAPTASAPIAARGNLAEQVTRPADEGEPNQTDDPDPAG